MTQPTRRTVLVEREIVATSRHCATWCQHAQIIGVGPRGSSIRRCVLGAVAEVLDVDVSVELPLRTQTCLDAEGLLDASPEPGK